MPNFDFDTKPEVVGAWGETPYEDDTYTRSMYKASGSKETYMIWIARQKQKAKEAPVKKAAYEKFLSRERGRLSMERRIRSRGQQKAKLARLKALSDIEEKKKRAMGLAEARKVGLKAAIAAKDAAQAIEAEAGEAPESVTGAYGLVWNVATTQKAIADGKVTEAEVTSATDGSIPEDESKAIHRKVHGGFAMAGIIGLIGVAGLGMLLFAGG